MSVDTRVRRVWKYFSIESKDPLSLLCGLCTGTYFLVIDSISLLSLLSPLSRISRSGPSKGIDGTDRIFFKAPFIVCQTRGSIQRLIGRRFGDFYFFE